MSFFKKLHSFFYPEASGERARDTKGRFKSDDKKTPNVNEAYKDGKKPKAKTKAKRGRGRPKGSKNKPKK
jgi:hypothetical protein